MVIKETPIPKIDLIKTVKTILSEITGGQIEGNTITKNDKTMAQVGWDSNGIWIHIVCEKPDYANFKAGEIEENLSPVKFTQAGITTEFLTVFNKVVNKSEIVLNGEYLVADEHDRFVIVNNKDDERFISNGSKNPYTIIYSITKDAIR